MPTLTTTPQSGFTLLELVIVMFIIGLIASTPLLFIDNQDEQLRYEETLQKMELIRRGLYQRESYNNQPILSGFIVDNGVLPNTTDVQEFINAPISGWLSASVATPSYDVNSASGDLPPKFALNKGYRIPYIKQGLDSDNNLKDGWGNIFAINTSGASASGANAGYNYAFNSPSTNYNDVSHALSGNHWQIPLSALNIILENTSSTAITGVPLAVIVFRNKAGSERWTTYHFDASVPASSQQHSNTTASWDINSSGAIATSTSTYIPAGDHWVIYNPASAATVAVPAQILRVIPGATQPTLTLTVSP